VDPSDLPPYKDFLLPVLHAVQALGGTAHAKEITAWMVENLPFDDDAVAVEYPNRPGESILLDRMAWARSYDKLGGLVETPQRGLYVLTTEGKRVLSLPEAEARQVVEEMDREVRRGRTRQKRKTPIEQAESDPAPDPELSPDSEEEADSLDLKAALLARLHALTPRGFEDFVVHLLKSYGMELARVGGPTDEGVDAIGLAPVSDVLADRVAVQIKRYDPEGSRSNIERRDVALFQRDAAAKGAERAVFVTLGSFSQAARKAATGHHAPREPGGRRDDLGSRRAERDGPAPDDHPRQGLVRPVRLTDAECRPWEAQSCRLALLSWSGPRSSACGIQTGDPSSP
jgi:restriction system protein